MIKSLALVAAISTTLVVEWKKPEPYPYPVSALVKKQTADVLNPTYLKTLCTVNALRHTNPSVHVDCDAASSGVEIDWDMHKIIISAPLVDAKWNTWELRYTPGTVGYKQWKYSSTIDMPADTFISAGIDIKK